MARRRYLSTDISLSRRVNRLAMEYGDFAALLYTWLIAWAEDDCTIHGTPEQIKWQVVPGRNDKTVEDIERALAGMASEGIELITWDREAAEIMFPPETFYKYQSYIGPARRRNADQRKPAQTAADRRKATGNAASLSSSLSFSVSKDADADARARAREGDGVPSSVPPTDTGETGVPSSGSPADCGAGVPSSSPPADAVETGVPTPGSPADNDEGVPSPLSGPVPSGGQDADPVFAEVEREYFNLTGRICSPLDLQDISQTLRDAERDAALIIRVMRQVARRYTPKREGDGIRSFGYFREAILDELARIKTRKEGEKSGGGAAKHTGAYRGQDRGIADLMGQ